MSKNKYSECNLHLNNIEYNEDEVRKELNYIVDNIVKRRNELGISQRDLAASCGIPQSSVSRIESLKTTPNLLTMLKMIQPLGIKISITSKEE